MPEETENGVPVIQSATMAAHRRRQQHAEHGDERKFKIAVEREKQEENQEQGQRQNDLQLLARSRIFRVFSAPIQTVAARQGNLSIDLLNGIAHRPSQIASFHRELDADVARIVLAVNERGAVRHLDVRELLERNLLSGRRGHQDISDFLGVVPVLAIEADDEIELLFSLHHLGGHIPADGCLDQAVDVGDVQTETSNPGTVDLDGQTRLPELLHQRHITDSAHPLQDLFDGFALLLERIQIGAEYFDGQGAFQARFRLVDRILGRLGVIENDSGKGLELLVDGLNQRGFGAMTAGPLRVRLEPNVKLDVEETGRIRAVVGAAQFEATVVTSGKECNISRTFWERSSPIRRTKWWRASLRAPTARLHPGAA